MPELELLPEKTKRVEIRTQRKLGSGVSWLVLVLILYGAILFYNRSLEVRVQELDAQFSAFNQSRNRAQEDRLKEVESKLNRGQTLLGEHALWSKGFEKVQALTLPSVQFLSLNASLPELKFEFRATAPNLTAIAKQGANFLSDGSVKDISISQLKILTTGRTEFVIKITFNRDQFLK